MSISTRHFGWRNGIAWLLVGRYSFYAFSGGKAVLYRNKQPFGTGVEVVWANYAT